MWIANLAKLLVVSSLAQQMLNAKLLPVLICEYLSLILVILWYCGAESKRHFGSAGGKSLFFLHAQGCSTCLNPTHSTWTKWRAKRSRCLLTITGCAAWRSSTRIPKLLMATATDSSCGCTPWGCFSIPTPSNTCSPQVPLAHKCSPGSFAEPRLDMHVLKTLLSVKSGDRI